MKKVLLSIVATLACSLWASAQTYVTTGTPTEDLDWSDWTLMGETTEIDVYDSYVIIDKWLGTEGEDLRVDFNEEGDLTAMSLVTDGVAVEATTDGTYYYLYPQSKYCVMVYGAYSSVVANAPADDEDGNYVFLCSYIYDTAESDYTSAYFNWTWGADVEDVAELYTIEATPSNDADWDEAGYTAFLTSKPVTVTVYEDNSMLLSGWDGSGKDILYIEFDDEENITLMSALDEEYNTLAETAEGWIEFSINSDVYYYAQINVGEGYTYAYANAEEGYAFFSGYFYKTQTEYDNAYYNLEWTLEEDGIKTIETTEYDSNAVYYNLNGMRVDNPSNGIYIKCRNGKAEKTYIK